MPGLSPRSQAKKDEMDRLEREEKEKILWEKQEKKRLKRKVKEDWNNEQIAMRIKGWQINRYRKDPFKPGGTRGSGVGAGVSLYSHKHASDDLEEEEGVGNAALGLGSDSNGVWRRKGTLFVPVLEENGKLVLMYIVDDLPDNYEYRFTVCAVNGRGVSKESPSSTSIMVERPLPAGWNRYYDEKSRRFYYANLKMNLSLWHRPDVDPYFCEEAVMMMFNQAEIHYLRKLYDEEMDHFRAVLVDRFTDVLLEVGERMAKGRIIKLFRGYAQSDVKLTQWKAFMDIFMHIKKAKKEGALMAKVAQAANLALIIQKRAAAMLLSGNDKKMGQWELQYSAIADREFYFNRQTKQSSWDMPDDVRFFLPPALEVKLLKAFDFGHIEAFKQYYAMLDVDNSGDLTDREIKKLLEAMGVRLSPQGLAKLVQTVDLNGNGTIEFDEFCWMMFELSRTDKDSALADLRFDMGVKHLVGGVETSAGSVADDGSAQQGSASLLIDLQELGSKLSVASSQEVPNKPNIQSTHNAGGTGTAEAVSALTTAREQFAESLLSHRSDYSGLVVQPSGVLQPPLPTQLTATVEAKPSNDCNISTTQSLQTGGTLLNGEPSSVGSIHSPNSPNLQKNMDEHDMTANSGRRVKPATGALAATRAAVAVGPQNLGNSPILNSDVPITTDDSSSVERKETKAEREARRTSAKHRVHENYSFGEMDYGVNKLAEASKLSCECCGLANESFPCPKCFDVKYCSRRCQQDDFNRHKISCVPKSKEEIAVLKRELKEREEAEEARLLAENVTLLEAKRLEAEQQADDEMFERWEEEGRPLLGPLEEIDAETGEVCIKHISWKDKQKRKWFACLFPKQAAAIKARDKLLQDKVERRRKRLAEAGEALRLRDINSKHGPHCFCGCRAF